MMLESNPHFYPRIRPLILPPHRGSKRAVIIGISYRCSEHELKGSIPDAEGMKTLLINKFNFPESSIIMLTDDDNFGFRIFPFKHNIMTAMNWLTRGCQSGDSLVFYYSGHGSYSRYEVNNVLRPFDFETDGMITDDEINNTLVRPIHVGAKLHAVINACHSGSVLGLPFISRINRGGEYRWRDHSLISGLSNGGEVICFSTYDDNQTSTDSSVLSKITSTGPLTFSFIQAILHGHGASYHSILTAMLTTITNVGNGHRIKGGDMLRSLLSNVLAKDSPKANESKQGLVLSASREFDVYNKPFIL